MNAQPVLWSVIGVCVVAALALLVPGSPAYLPGLFGENGSYLKERAVRHWLEMADSPDDDTRAEALYEIGAMGPDAGEAVPRLAQILSQSDSPRDRIQASLALSKMAPVSRPAVTALTGALKDGDGFVRMNSAMALGELHTDARAAVPALIEALKDKANQTNLNTFVHTIQEQVALALGRASAGTAEAVPALTEALEKVRADKPKIADPGAASIHQFTSFRAKIALTRALGEVGPEARPALPLLEKMLNEDVDYSEDLRLAARGAIEKITGKPVVLPANSDKKAAARPKRPPPNAGRSGQPRFGK
jgi:HEAT repeat protein